MVNKKSQKSTCRVILNVPIELDKAFRELADNGGIAKSQLIIYAMSFYRDYKSTLTMLPSLIDAINKSENQGKSKK